MASSMEKAERRSGATLAAMVSVHAVAWSEPTLASRIEAGDESPAPRGSCSSDRATAKASATEVACVLQVCTNGCEFTLLPPQGEVSTRSFPGSTEGAHVVCCELPAFGVAAGDCFSLTRLILTDAVFICTGCAERKGSEEGRRGCTGAARTAQNASCECVSLIWLKRESHVDSALPPEIVRECRESTWLSSKVLRLAALDLEEVVKFTLNAGAALGAR
jgi:hypothetical protein